jgi:hypothetical protein
MSDTKFIRKNGRIIPIRTKENATGAAMIASGTALSVASGILSGKELKKAEAAFGRSANLRGASKLVMGKSSINSTYNKIIRDSASFKIAGKKFSKRSSAILFAGTTIGGIVGSIGANRLLSESKKDKDGRALKVEAVGLVTGLAGLVPFGKAAKLKSVLRLAKSKTPVKEAFKAWSTQGARKTSETIRKYSSAGFKGTKAKSKDIFDAKPQDLFGKSPSFNLNKWIKKI